MMKVRDAIKLIQSNGWYELRMRKAIVNSGILKGVDSLRSRFVWATSWRPGH